ncbi:MAG: DsbA family protein [Pseudomonadales bacterium]
MLVVTDPLCSWCWGMAPAVEEAAARLMPEVEFDLLLGGINTTSTQPVGDYGRRLLLRIWREVHATTGQAFGFGIPDGLVYNSTLPCLAVAAVRRETGRPPFGYLHRLQQLLFVEGRNVNDVDVLAGTATDFGVPATTLKRALADAALQETLRDEFAGAREYGTQALPNVLVECDGERRLLAGGYADADMLETLVRARQAARQARK